MSERLNRLKMRVFRGVPGEMVVDFGTAQSIVIFGDNGTGKSTIADALEWYFTGNIELLAHEGRQHAVRNIGEATEGETSVELDTTGSLGGLAVHSEERNPHILDVASRETFLLRGRTLADFINKTKTEKWKALVEILGLDSVEGLRQDLQKARSDLRKEAKAADERLKASAEALGGSTVTEEGLLAELERFCSKLGIESPRSIDRAVDPSWIAAVTRVAAPGSDAQRQGSLVAELEVCPPLDIDREGLAAWNELTRSEGAQNLPRLSLLREAEIFVAKTPLHGACPLCGQAVEEKSFGQQLATTLQSLREASKAMESCHSRIQGLAATVSAAGESRDAVRAKAEARGIPLPPLPHSPSSAVSESIRDGSPVDEKALDRYGSRLKQWDEEAKSTCRRTAPSAPNSREANLVMLAQICEHIRAWRSAKRQAQHLDKAKALADKVFAAYQDHQQQHLSKILEQITDRVADIYGKLHPGEGLSRVSVEPWTAKGVELAIDFHGSRQRPPHGVLSESHLNSLAIALFLAMAETFNEKLRFLVLDDVINSFDLEHRGQLADLLASEFNDWQLIILTHDHQFYEHLIRRAHNWKKLELTSWSYEGGPRTTRYETGGMLAAARRSLVEGDASGAAMKARRALEELLQEICEAIGALLPFCRGAENERREIGQLDAGLRRILKDRAKPFYRELDPLLTNLFADVQATLNVEAHAGRGRASATEIEATLNRMEELDALWSCSSCATRIWHKGTPESSQCKCGKSRFPPPAS